MIFSDDRGVNISISDNSYFLHSRFDKGLIVYEGLTNIQSSTTNTVIVLAREFWQRLSTVSTLEKAAAVIQVKHTVFHNLAIGLSLDKLSYGSMNSTVQGMDSIDYQYFDNFGSVLNARKFPG